MTGIERLHKLIADIDVSADPKLWDILRWGTEGGWDCENHDGKTLDSTLAAIANQIEREQGEHVSRMRVLAVVTEMERHVSGVEGMEDSPVARWARELRAALGGDGRDHAADVSMSAYDLLPQEDREAIAWVREHGGLDAVKRRWECLSYYADPVPRSCMDKRLARLQRQIDESHAALRRRNQRIAVLASEINRAHNENYNELMHRAGNYMAFADEVCKRLAPQLRHVEGCTKDVMDAALEALDRRLMPEGYEWPRYESGEPLRYEDRYVYDGREREVWHVDFDSYGEPTILNKDGTRFHPDKGERVKRPTVLASDGEPLEVRQTVWNVNNGMEFTVSRLPKPGEYQSVEVRYRNGSSTSFDPDQLTHQRPVLDADGVPIKVGDTVWMVDDPDGPYGVTKVTTKYATHVHGYSDELGDLDMIPSQLTHRAPALAADGEPLEVGQTVWWLKNPTCHLTVDRVDSAECVSVTDRFDGEAQGLSGIPAKELTHQRPVLDADGVPIKKGDTVYLLPGKWCDVFPCSGFHGGEELEVFADGEASHVPGGVQCRETEKSLGSRGTCYPQPSQLTHTKPEPPDSWESIEEDAKKCPCHYFGHERNTCDGCPVQSVYGSCRTVMTSDLVRRCKALEEKKNRNE